MESEAIKKKLISIRLDESTVLYFKKLAKSSGIKYQNLINLYLKDCAEKNKKVHMKWK
jgi:predicted DNA binding CopG/RHH family protein